MEEEVRVVELVDGFDGEVPAAALDLFAFHLAFGARGHGDGLRLSLADKLQFRGFAFGQETNPSAYSRQILDREPGHGRAIDFHDAVTGLDAGASGGAFRVGLGHHDAFVLGKINVPVEVLQGLQLEPCPAPVHLAVLADLIGHHPSHLDGDCEPEVAPTAHHAASVEPDDFPEGVHQRATGIAGIDRGVGLEPGTVFARSGQVALRAGNDADGHGPRESERCAHRHDEVALDEVGRNAQLREGQGLGVGRAFQFQQGHVGVLVRAQDLRLEGLTVGEEAADLGGLVHHMPVGEQFAIRRNEDPRSGDFLCLPFAALHVFADTLDEHHRRKDTIFG